MEVIHTGKDRRKDVLWEPFLVYFGNFGVFLEPSFHHFNQASLTNAFKSLLENEDFVDVTLSAGGKTLRAHKVVLSACSSYFKQLLRGKLILIYIFPRLVTAFFGLVRLLEISISHQPHYIYHISKSFLYQLGRVQEN